MTTGFPDSALFARTNVSRAWQCARVLLAWLILSGTASAADPKIDVIERFDGNSFNRKLWELAQPDPAIGKVEVKEEALYITIPPRPDTRPQIHCGGKFTFDGDFVVKMDFELLDPLPNPSKDYINVELIVFGTEGHAHLSRSNHHGSGNGFVSFFDPEDKSKGNHWKHTKTEAQIGTIVIEREQKTTRFLTVIDGHETVLTTTELPLGQVKRLGIAVTVVPPIDESFRVKIDNLEVHTGPKPAPIVPSSPGTSTPSSTPRVAESSLGPWIALTALLVLATVGLLVWNANRTKPTLKQPTSAPQKKSPTASPKQPGKLPANKSPPDKPQPRTPGKPPATKVDEPDALDDFEVS